MTNSLLSISVASRVRAWHLAGALAGACVLSLPGISALAQTRAPANPNMADYIIAVVNQELVTNGELQMRLNRIRDEAARSKAVLPPVDELRRQVLEGLVDERVQITTRGRQLAHRLGRTRRRDRRLGRPWAPG